MSSADFEWLENKEGREVFLVQYKQTTQFIPRAFEKETLELGSVFLAQTGQTFGNLAKESRSKLRA